MMLYDAIIIARLASGSAEEYNILVDEIGPLLATILTIYFIVELYFRIYASGYVRIVQLSSFWPCSVLTTVLLAKLNQTIFYFCSAEGVVLLY